MEASLAMVGATELAYLSSLSPEGEAYYRHVPQKTAESEEGAAGTALPLFRGNVADFEEANPGLVEQMRNVAKKCGGCGKSCATILPFCNGCDGDLSDAAEESTENVCMAFVYGVERSSRGPLALSMRSEEKDLLVYDDLLARGSCHLNAIPSDCHLPDWRHLLRNPSKGLSLMSRLNEACWQVVRDQFWGSEEWRLSTFRVGAFSSAEDFRSQIYAGVNAVPSQFQIHLQYIVQGIGPSDYHAFLHGKRFVRDRWLPLEYVMGSLKALAESGSALPDAHHMPMDAIFAAIAASGGPVYADVYSEAIRRYNRTHRACANWRPEHFEVSVAVRHPALRPELHGAAPDSPAGETAPFEVRPLRAGAVAVASLTPVDLERKDKASIQSYGRPYGPDGQPVAASYYSYPRRPGEVTSADEWVALAA